MQKHDDGSVTLSPDEARHHSSALSQALVALKAGGDVARNAPKGDPFGAGLCEAVFVLDCSGSMASSMDGSYSADWHQSKMGHLHELIQQIMKDVAIEAICVGTPPASVKGSVAGRRGDLLVLEGEGLRPVYGPGAKGYYGAWLASNIPAQGCGGTPLSAGLQLALNRGRRDITVISDGLPQGVDICLDIANEFDRIDAWFLGNGDMGSSANGRDFMRQLHRGAGTFGSTNLGNENVRRRIANKVAGYLGGFGTGG